jgi:hypothetical protein
LSARDSTAFFTVILGATTFAHVILTSASALQLVPQEFGGVKPKLAILDLERSALSPELADSLAEPEIQTNSIAARPAVTRISAAVMRSRCVYVFSTADPWLVQIRAADRIGKSGRAIYRSIRISSDAVHSVEWIDPAALRTFEKAACTATR